MKKSAIKKIDNDIKEKTKLPKDIKEKIKKDIFTNIIVAVIIITYFIFIILGSSGAIKNVRSIDLNIFSLIFLGITILLFEIAYKKDSGSLAAFGLESLIVALFTLFLPYIIFELDSKHRKYYLFASIYIAIYYAIKSIIIYIKTKSKYMNSISDVKEIVKKDETKRKQRDEDIEEVEKTETKEDRESIKNVKESKVKNDKKDNTKKRGRPKKIDVKENKKESNITKETIETVPLKKRGRPKKNTEIEKKKEENAPKKRGRPRKVAI